MRGPPRHRAGTALLLGILAALWSCSRDEPRLSPLAPDDTVVALGDSLTAGTGAPAGESYPEVLGRLLGRPVLNAGRPGETTTEGLRRLSSVLEAHHPRLVILCEGGNDFLRGTPPKVVVANLRRMIQTVREFGAELVLVAVPRPGLLVPVPDLYEDLGEEFGIPVEAEVLREVLTAPALKSDPIHPNARGYRRIAEALASLLRRAGAVD
ncbi:arylesterase [Deferrisoma camini]|uniref:arylesterase n=1 Tax=Deferrisoma camini TaxID=1035120 RepID=UPI00046D826E|nr:arylesterase [Deferrisoma camini]